MSGDKGAQAAPLPDVSIESKARKTPRDNDCWYLDIQYTAVCNHGCGSYHTDDVNQAIIWAVEHENSDEHILSKWDRMTTAEKESCPRHFVNRVELISAKMADQGASTLYKYSKPDNPIGGMEKHEH